MFVIYVTKRRIFFLFMLEGWDGKGIDDMKGDGRGFKKERRIGRECIGKEARGKDGTA